MMKISTLVAVIACVSSTCHAYQLIGTEALSGELVAQHYTINPNLDAVIVVDRTIPTFEYQTFYGAGSADEAEGQQGRIHFLEHIMADTDKIIIKNGGQPHASTSFYFTRFILRFPKDKFDLAVEIDRDRFYNTVIDEEVVEREKKIVLTERSRRLSSLTQRFANHFFSVVYGKKNFTILGSEAFIEQLEPDDLKAYYENFLRFQKRLIVVIGDVEVDQVLAKLDEAYGRDQRPSALSSEVPAPQVPNPDALGKKFRVTYSKISIAKFRKSWVTPGLGHRDYAGLLILTRMLNKIANSLRSHIVDSGLARVFSVSLSHYKGFGLMNCYADLPHDTSLDAVHALILVEFMKLKSISEEDLDAARNELLYSMYSGFYDRSGMAYQFGKAFAHANDPLLHPKLIRDMKSIRAEDIPRLIDQYLTDDNSITLSLTLKREDKNDSQEPKKRFSKKTMLGLAIIVWIAFTVLFASIWIIKKLHRKFSRKAIVDATADADERE